MAKDYSNRSFFDNWQFFIHCSGDDIYAVYSIMQSSNIALKDRSYKPEDALKSLFVHRYGSEEMVSYTKYITDLCDDLGIKNVKGDSIISKEGALLLHIISKSVESFSDKELGEFKNRAGLTNDSKDAIIRETAAKANSSLEFKKMLPALASIALGVGVNTSSLAALGLGVAAISMIGRPVATIGLANRIVSRIRKKQSAEQVLPAMAVIIRIRREFLIDFHKAEEAVAFLRTTIRTCEYSDKERVAVALLLAFLQKDTEYGNPEVLDTIRRMVGIYDEDIITEQKVDAIMPFVKDVEHFLCAFIQENGDSLSVLSTLFPNESNVSTSPDQNNDDGKDLRYNLYETDSNGKRIAELELRVARIERILHGIRHNLAPDFANALNPYREFLENPSIPISIEEARNAEAIGSRIFSLLNRAGKEEYGSSESIDLVQILEQEFTGDSYSVEFRDLPSEAIGEINKLSFETQVLNNIRKNLCQHAFGAYTEDTVPIESRRVQISIEESGFFWLIIIRNNGEPFPEKANIEEIWDYGRSFGKRALAEGGTGMFYIKDCVEHFGGEVDFIPLSQGDFTIEYRIKIKKT